MLNETYLKEDFEISGSDLEECRTLITEISKNTHFERINSASINILSYYPVKNSKKLNFYKLNPDGLPSDNPELRLIDFSAGLSKGAILKKGDFQYMIDEIENLTKVAIYKNIQSADKLNFASENVFASMESFGLKGRFLSQPSLERDMIIAKQFKKEKDITLVTRNFDKVKKVFAILSDRYAEVSQLEIFSLIDKLINDEVFGKVRCSRWVVNHFITFIELEFPEKAQEICQTYGLPNNFVPGIRITTSDTGNSSFRVTGTWRIKNSLTLTNSVAKRHLGSININEIIEDVDKNIFADYVKIPEALCDLMLKNITPSTLDLSTSADREKNTMIIKDVIKSTFSELEIVKAIGKRQEVLIRKLMLDEIDPSISYTAYDIAMQILTLPERLEGLSKMSADNLSKAIAKAPFCKYKIQNEDDLFLI